MRWDELFADLESQAAALARAERAGEIGERTRGEVAALSLLDRLRAAIGSSVRLHLQGGLALSGTVNRVGPDWLLLDEQDAREAVVGLAGVLRVRGLGRYAAVPDSMSMVESRLSLRHALRGIARDRSAARVHLTDGAVLDATLDRIGADFLEVARHAPGETRRRGEVREVEAVPLSALVAVRRG